MERKPIVVILLLSIVTSNLFSQIGPVKINLYSSGNKLNADYYQAPGDQKHPTLILMHGFGNVKDELVGTIYTWIKEIEK